MAKRQPILVAAIALTVFASAAGMLVAFSPASGPDEEAVRAAAVQDDLISVFPWIPCTDGHAAVLSAATVQAQHAQQAALVQQTYAPIEPTHANMLAHLQDLVDQYGPGGSAVAGGNTLCEPSGGVDQVQVLNFAMTGTTASITIQCHIWNETIGTQNGVPFHYRPESVITRTDEAAKINGQWLITHRGEETFVSGAP